MNLDWNEQSLAVKARLDQDKITLLGLSSDLVGRLVTQFRGNDLLIDVVLRTERRDVDAQPVDAATRQLFAIPVGWAHRAAGGDWCGAGAIDQRPAGGGDGRIDRSDFSHAVFYRRCSVFSQVKRTQ